MFCKKMSEHTANRYKNCSSSTYTCCTIFCKTLQLTVTSLVASGTEMRNKSEIRKDFLKNLHFKQGFS